MAIEDEIDMNSFIATIVAMVVYVFIKARMRNRRPSVKYAPIMRRDHMRQEMLSRLYNMSDEHCISQLRMHRSVFFKLCLELRSRSLLCDTIHCTVEEQVGMFLNTIGLGQTNREVGFNFIRSGETVSRYFHEVLNALGTISVDMIRHKSLDIPGKIKFDDRFHPYFKDCIGAIDGTHIPAFVPASKVDKFRGRKAYPTQNVLAVCDFELRFTYVLAGWEGSAHDSLVLSEALNRPTGLRVPEGKYYLADAGYAARPGFLPPYRGVRYHLKEYNELGPRDEKELFNLRHSSLRTTIERAFGSLKKRFRVMRTQPFYNFPTQVDIVLACCALHNWILDNGASDQYMIEDDDQPDTDYNSDNEDEINTSHFMATTPSTSTARQSRREQRDENRAWVNMRQRIADDMWSNYVL